MTKSSFNHSVSSIYRCCSTIIKSTVIKMTLASSLLLLSQTSNAETCPQQFFDLPMPEKATTCHSFMEQFPAALSFYVPQSPEQVKQFYQNSQIVITQASKHLGRYVMHANDKQLRIIISEDEAGTQVDLLALKN